jgi:hypothetical protein
LPRCRYTSVAWASNQAQFRSNRSRWPAPPGPMPDRVPLRSQSWSLLQPLPPSLDGSGVVIIANPILLRGRSAPNRATGGAGGPGQGTGGQSPEVFVSAVVADKGFRGSERGCFPPPHTSANSAPAVPVCNRQSPSQSTPRISVPAPWAPSCKAPRRERGFRGGRRRRRVSPAGIGSSPAILWTSGSTRTCKPRYRASDCQRPVSNGHARAGWPPEKATLGRIRPG